MRTFAADMPGGIALVYSVAGSSVRTPRVASKVTR
jgi:hypothetical protein